MKVRTYIFIIFTALFFLLPAYATPYAKASTSVKTTVDKSGVKKASAGRPAIILAGQKEVIFNYELLTSPEYLNSANQWQIFNNKDDGLYGKDGGLLLKSDGDPYLVYPISFNYHDYDQLKITFFTNQPVRVTVIPNISTTGFNTFELRKNLPAGEGFKEINFSLRLPFFKDVVSDIGINFYTKNPADIIIKEISLEKLTWPGLLIQAVKDYWQVAPYSPFTVNVFPTPRIFGYSALVYFLPIILILIWLILFNKKRRKIAGVILLLFWLLTDIRMSYEAVAHNLDDYKSFVKPPVEEKNLRTYDDFYQFADWVAENLISEEPLGSARDRPLGSARDRQELNFYNFGSAHFPRLLQYLIYPIRVYPEEGEAKMQVVFNRKEISYNETDQKLYKSGKPFTEAGEIIASYNKYSFIFEEK